MSNLFSVFDPVSFPPYLSLNWFSLMNLFFLPASLWVVKSNPLRGLSLLTTFFSKELSLVLGKEASSEKALLVALFVLVFCNNFAGLFPYVFTATSHLVISLSLGLIIWAGYLVLSVQKNPSSALAHLVPAGTPMLLAPFMVLIELVSNFMRPLTLSIRLAANMVAGHLLLSLISGPLTSVSWLLVGGLMIVVVAMMCLEMGVAFIQGYVFMTLSSLYISEVSSSNLK